MKKLVFLFLILIFSLFSFSVSAFAGTLKFSFYPTSTTEKSYDDVMAGDKISGELILKLHSSEAAEFEMLFESSSGSAMAKKGSGSFMDMSTWINFPNGEKIYFEPVEEEGAVREVIVPFEVTIPDDIVPGDYRASMKASLLKDEGDDSSGAGVEMNSAVGVMFAFSVPGERVHGMELVDLLYRGYVETAGPRLIVGTGLKFGLVYKNWGNSLVRPILDVYITDTWGNVIFDDKVENLGDSFPSDSSKTSDFVLDDMEPFYGWMNIDVKVSYVPVDLKGQLTGDSFEVGEASLRVYNIPWWFFVPPFVVFVFILFYFFLKSYRLNRLISVSKIYIVKEGDTLHSLCNKFKVDPKGIIVVNKLKDPYFINPGDELFVPIK